jgi:Arc/MetJ-type ribon-helix-helix transcriptional regulator
MGMKTHADNRKSNKTISLDPQLIRAVNASIEAGAAKDFSEAVAMGLGLLLESEGFPTELTADQIAARLREEARSSGDPLIGQKPYPGAKKSHDSKFSRGTFVKKDPTIERIRKKKANLGDGI